MLILLLAAMTVLIGSQVFARYLFDYPLHWTEELGRHLMVWMVFLASTICLRRGSHLNINFLEQRLGLKARMALGIFMTVLLGYFFYLMIVHGWTLTQKTMGQRSSALHYPMGLVYAAMPVSGLLMFLINLDNFVRSVAKLRRGVPPEEEASDHERGEDQ